MSTNIDIQLISEFLQREEIFAKFQYFLEVKNIAETEAESIIKTLEYEDVVELTDEELHSLESMMNPIKPIYLVN